MSKKKITIDEVKHIAKLSKLEIPEDELDYYATEMGKIINYFDLLSGVDTSSVEPMIHVNKDKSYMDKNKIYTVLKCVR